MTRSNQAAAIYLVLEDVAETLSISESTVQKLVREGEFPKPRLLSGRRVGWLRREIEKWAEERPVADLPPPPNTGAKKPKHKLDQMEP